MTYSNITYIGAYSLIAFCSVITHTILPIPPTVIFFVCHLYWPYGALSVMNLK